jgi:hypothetical protein
MRSYVGLAALCGGVVLLSDPAAIEAQQPVPIQGVTGTMALDGTVEQEYTGANTVIVKTMDGVRHAFHFASDLLVHGGKGSGVDALQGLREGTTVVVHYTTSGSVESAEEIDRVGDPGLKVTEGVVTDINRGKKQITIRFDNGTHETLALTDRAAADVGKDIDPASKATIVVYYFDNQSGQKVAHFFRKAS